MAGLAGLDGLRAGRAFGAGARRTAGFLAFFFFATVRRATGFFFAVVFLTAPIFLRATGRFAGFFFCRFALAFFFVAMSATSCCGLSLLQPRCAIDYSCRSIYQPVFGPARRPARARVVPVAAGERITMKSRVLVLGAGFGGMELSTLLSEALGEKADVTLIDKDDAFVFGFSKLDVMFGRTTPEAVRLPYRHFVKPGVCFLHETIQAIDPAARRAVTDEAPTRPTSW